MSPVERWTAIDGLQGWRLCSDVVEFEESVKAAHLKRHPRHDSYIPISETKRLTEAEGEEYDRLNRQLHEEMRRVSHEYFADVPVPKELREERGDETYFTPFTYQNYDWYGPSYECYFVVLMGYISADLLKELQLLLHGDHADWCIRVIGSDGLDFDSDHDIAVFSDAVFVPADDAQVMQIPSPGSAPTR